MAGETQLVKKIKVKTNFLEFLREKTQEILARNIHKDVVRQLRIYESKLDEIQDIKTAIQELKLARKLEQGKDPDEVRKRRADLEVEVRKFQPYTERLSNALHDFKQREQHEEEKELNQAKQRQFEMEIELEKLKFKQRLELEAKLEEIRGKPEATQKQISVKLPKLEITKFKGTHMDWFRFWSQFETEVDRQNIDPVTKFNYLKEFLEPKLCRKKLAWDDPAPEEERQCWKQWLAELQTLQEFSVDRCFKPETFGEPNMTELHHFSDASEAGYRAVSYIRMTNNKGAVHCAFVTGKSRLSPLKYMTIPRLELSAATVAVKLDQKIRKELDCEIKKSIFWTDSQAVLRYIYNENRRFQTFVANRLAIIHEGSDPEQWRGCFLTSSLIGTLALGLVTPITMAWDMCFNKLTFSWMFIGGTIPVFLSFFAVSILGHYGDWDPVLDFLKWMFGFLHFGCKHDQIAPTDGEQRESLMDNEVENSSEIDTINAGR
eukprot:Seg1376.1 transcript_id=Seg1376.1/GoldUCD/mRNA.D3Y31 product="Solute carrier family 35 member F5" protein_id=Seg1376.1/GoldUCD/D3Y31